MNKKRSSFIDFYSIRQLIERFISHNITASGSQMAYFLLLSIFPFLMFVIVILGYMEIPVDDAIYFLSSIVPKDIMSIFGKYIEYLLTERNSNLLFISLTASFMTASSALDALTIALNKSFEIKETRSYIKRRLLVVPFTILFTLCITVALTIPILGKGFLIWISKYIEISRILIEYLRYLRWLVALFTIFNVISIIYYIAPNIKQRIIDIVPGACFATFGWILLSLGISIYFSHIRGYTIIYGSIGAVIMLMIWLFWGSMIIILGGEINAVLMKKRLDMKVKHKAVTKNKFMMRN